MQQAGAGSIGEKGIRAGADQKDSLQGVDRDIDRTSIGKRAVIIALSRACTSIFEQARSLMIAAQKDVWKALVVANQDIKAWPQPLDEIGFQQQCFSFGMCGDELHVGSFRDHAGRSVAPVTNPSGVVLYPVAQAFRLADIQDITGRIHHSVDAGFAREAAHQIANQLSTGLAGGDVGFLPQDIPRVALFGASHWLINGLGAGR